jgi:hypothetical protein
MPKLFAEEGYNCVLCHDNVEETLMPVLLRFPISFRLYTSGTERDSQHEN